MRRLRPRPAPGRRRRRRRGLERGEKLSREARHREDRELTEREREIIDFLLSGDFPGAEILRAQSATARVVGRCPCGCATINVEVDPSTQALWPLPTRVPIETRVRQQSDPERLFELLLFLDDGRITSVEIVWHGSEPPTEFPKPEEFQEPFVHPELLEGPA